MKIAVVVLNWNGKNLLEKFLPSVVKFSSEATIYVADNASDDESIPFIEKNFPSVIIIKNVQNFGFAKGYNDALKHVDADIFALLNSDVEVTENWLTPIITTFKKEKNTAIIQPKILDYKNKGYFEYAGAAGGFIDKYGYPFCRGRLFESIEKDTNQYKSQSIFWASGACFFIRSNIFKDMNGFDDDFFAHQEEIDLCWRIYNRNYDIKYISESTIFHVGAATLQVSRPQKTFLNFRNSLLMLLKNLPKNKIIPIIFARMILDGVAAIRFLKQGKVTHFSAIFKAHFSFYSMIISTYKKRCDYQRTDYYTIKSVVKLYFLNKIVTFDKLF